ncbi:ABC transporter permease [Candidatus Saccharibacteria bacterium]|nr:MAG: ABC transporter permease [Candidatus Saccharibacteria bacterium]
MKNLNTLRRVLSMGAKNLFRNSWLTIAAIAVMIVSLVIIQLAVVLNVTASNAINQIAKNLKAAVYLKDDVSDSDRQKLFSALKANNNVDSIEYISPEKAQKDLAGSFKNNEEILQAYALVGGGVLPASYKVSVKDLSRISEVQTVAEANEFRDIVSNVSLGQTDAKKTIDRAAGAQKSITVGSIVAAGTLAIISIMIIFNTIRMAIFTRQEEIRIMKLIGATPNYIRGPFLVESALYGIIAGILANSIVYAMVVSIGAKVAEQAEFAATYQLFTKTSIMIAMLLGSILIGVMIGVFSSLLAMERHLKLKHW